MLTANNITHTQAMMNAATTSPALNHNTTQTNSLNESSTNLSSSSDVSLASSIMQQLTSSSQSSSLASASLLLFDTATTVNDSTKQTKSYHRISSTCRMESDKILSSSSNYMIHGCGGSGGGGGCSAALAEAELDELDDLCDEVDASATQLDQKQPTNVNNTNATLASLSDEVDFACNETSSSSFVSCQATTRSSTTETVNENSVKLIASSSSALIGGASDLMSSSHKVSAIKQNLLNASTASTFSSVSSAAPPLTTVTSSSNIVPTVVLSPEEKVSNEAKEYWATIDLYNNSKMAFNKRLKSVKLKREKLNIEFSQRQQQTQLKPTTQNDSTTTIDPITATNTSSCLLLTTKSPATTDTQSTQCMCVKCSIVYHESVIKSKVGTAGTKTCAKCNKPSSPAQCKCCSQNLHCEQTSPSLFDYPPGTDTAKASSVSIGLNGTLLSNNSELESLKSSSSLISSSSHTISSESAVVSSTIVTKTVNTNGKQAPIKQELSQLDDKLFNIKNELVNLSETSLDVFQLLLQLSDTMLDINTQLNNNQSSLNYSQAANSNLFPLNTFMGSETNNFLYEEEEEEGEGEEDDPEIEELTAEQENELIKKQHLKLNTSSNNANTALLNNTSTLSSNGANNNNNTSTISSSSIYKTNVIEEFLHKTLNTSRSSSNSLRVSSPSSSSSSSNPTASGSSISNIINTLNNRNHSSVARNGSFFSTPSQSFRSTLTANKSSLAKPTFNRPLHLKPTDSASSSTSSPSSVANLIENIYDKTSVTQFVDSLLNHNTGAVHSACKSKAQSINSIDETSNMSDCCYSTLSSTTTTHTTEPVYQSIDPDYMNSASLVSKNKQHLSTVATTLTTSQILARQPVASLVSAKQHQSFNLKKANSIYATNQMKSSQSNCSSSSSSSSSSGCGGSSSICSSSNTDLTYMTPENNNNSNGSNSNNRNSTSSTSSSVLASPLSCLSTSSSNNEIINQASVKKATPEHLPQVRAYESSYGGSGSSSSSSSPQNSLISGSSAFSYSSGGSTSATLNQYKRSNSVNYKSMNSSSQLPTASTSSIANRKPSFKFESNILNKVQFMNSNKINEQTNSVTHSAKPTSSSSSPLKSLNEVMVPSHLLLQHQQESSINKRNSLGRDEIFEQSQKLIKRQQSVNSHKSFQNQPSLAQLRTIQQMNSLSSTSNNNKTPGSPSIIINQIKMNQHQMSLDSGIYLPSEAEEYNSFNLNLVR